MTITEKQLRDALDDFSHKSVSQHVKITFYNRNKETIQYALQFALDMRWREVGKEHPKNEEVVLVRWDDGEMQVGTYFIQNGEGDYWFQSAYGKHMVNKICFKHWLPLEAPPETQGEG